MTEQPSATLAAPKAKEPAAEASTQAVATPPASSQDAPIAPSRQLEQQKAFLLQQLNAVPGHQLERGAANKILRTKPVREGLNLDPNTANHLREEMAQQGYLRITRQGQTITYELTEEGGKYLQTLEQPTLSGRRASQVYQVSPEMEKNREAFLLLQILEAEVAGEPLAKVESNRKVRSLGKSLEEGGMLLNATTANQIRSRLAQEGCIQVVRQGRNESYQLTPAGEQRLVQLRQQESREFKVPGTVLNRLVEIARGSARSATSAAQTSHDSPAAMDLAQAAFAEYEELLQERFSATSRVPIHEVRRRIATKYGQEKARHDVLDAKIRELQDQGRVRLIAIGDPREASEQQLSDSIPGVDQTFFYLGAGPGRPGQ